MKTNKRDKHVHNQDGIRKQRVPEIQTIPKTKDELFKKYSIDESHSKWESIDSWMGVEVFRVMHNGALPTENDTSSKHIIDFLDKTKDIKFMVELMKRKDWGSLYLTAKRMVYMLHEEILNELNGK